MTEKHSNDDFCQIKDENWIEFQILILLLVLIALSWACVWYFICTQKKYSLLSSPTNSEQLILPPTTTEDIVLAGLWWEYAAIRQFVRSKKKTFESINDALSTRTVKKIGARYHRPRNTLTRILIISEKKLSAEYFLLALKTCERPACNLASYPCSSNHHSSDKS